MALLFIDGFHHYVSPAQKWQLAIGQVACSTEKPRFGTKSLRINRTNGTPPYLLKFLPGLYDTLILGFAYNANGNQKNTDFRFTMPDNFQSFLKIEANIGRVQVGNLYGVLATSAEGHFNPYAWNYFEFKMVRAVSGSLTVRCNGSTILTYTGDTSAYPQANGFEISDNNDYSGTAYIADLYVADGSGSVNNDFLGDIRVMTLYPDTAGYHQDFEVAGAANSVEAVNEEGAPNLDSYVHSDVAGEKQIYGLQNLPNTALAVYGLQMNILASKTDGGQRDYYPLLRIGGSDQRGASIAALVGGDIYSRAVFETDPTTNALWTPSAIQALQAGVEII